MEITLSYYVNLTFLLSYDNHTIEQQCRNWDICEDDSQIDNYRLRKWIKTESSEFILLSKSVKNTLDLYSSLYHTRHSNLKTYICTHDF